MFRINTQYSSDAAPQGGGLKPGFYPAVCVYSEEGTDRNGNPGLKVKWQVQLPSRPLELTEWYGYSEKLAWKIERMLRCSGMQFQQGQAIDFGPHLMGGRKCWLLVGKTWNEQKGKLYSCVVRPLHKDELPEGVVPPGRGATDEELRSWGLNPDGTEPDRRQQGGAPAPAGGYPGVASQQQAQCPQQPQGGYGSGNYTPPRNAREAYQQAGAQLPHEDEDELPF